MLYGLFRPLFVGFAKAWFRLRVEGAGNVPATGPFILAPVHRSNIDFLVVLVCARRRMRYLGKDSLWKPGLRHLWNALGGIPVARGTADRAALQTCIKAIAAGEPLVMFPEGSRQSGPQIQPLFDGPAYVQSRTGAPIVPVGIGGSERAMPKGATFIRPHRITVVIGPPLEAASASAGGGAKARRSATRARTAELVAVLQDLFDRAQEQAGTPNR